MNCYNINAKLLAKPSFLRGTNRCLLGAKLAKALCLQQGANVFAECTHFAGNFLSVRFSTKFAARQFYTRRHIEAVTTRRS